MSEADDTQKDKIKLFVIPAYHDVHLKRYADVAYLSDIN